MSHEREQKLIDICFELIFAAHQNEYWFNKAGTEEVMQWTADQLRKCGFPTRQVGSSWGVLEQNDVMKDPVLTEGAMSSNIKNSSQETDKTPASQPPAPRNQQASSEDKLTSLLSNIYSAILDQNRLTENTNFTLARLWMRLGND